MKTIISIICLCFAISGNSQDVINNESNMYLGTWEHQIGNEIFRVFLVKDNELDNNAIYGHYEKVQINNGVETFIYCSDKEKFVGDNSGWLPYVISLDIGNNRLAGSLYEAVILNNEIISWEKL